jgi:ubiquinone/menaquinone biosynthesis C-methylase UbiE
MNQKIPTSNARKHTQVEEKRKNREQRFWNKISKKYDSWVTNAFSDQYKAYRSKFKSNVSMDDTVLEIGTGTGDIAFNLTGRCKKVIGTDISKGMIEIAQRKNDEKKYKNLTFLVEDAYHLSFPDSYFDKIVCCNILQVMKEPARAVSEGKRVLKPGGEFLSITYCYGDSSLFEQIKLIKWAILYGLPGYWSNFKCSEIKSYFEAADMRVLKSERIWTKPVVLFLRSKKED